MKLVSVVLSGGAGTRLWPASREAHPKPFMTLGGSTLLAQAIERGMACGTDQLVLVTNQSYQFLTHDVVAQIPDRPHAHYLLEPFGRNTAPAIALAALHCAAMHGPDAVMLVLPADHLIADTSAFVACAIEATHVARSGQLVVFGISPTSPETGYGYLEVASLDRNTQPVKRFVEKPDLKTAQDYLASGRYYWNSGIFCFMAQTMLDAMDQHVPEVLAAARKAFEASQVSGQTTRFDAHAFGLQPDVSIDYAVMEHAPNVTVVPARFSWSDVGSWPSVAAAHPSDASGNTLLADVVAVETSGTHVQVESHGDKVVGLVGVSDLVVVDTPDALLIASKQGAQKVKSVVERLKQRKHGSIQLPSVVHRPWGTYTTLKLDQGYQVKRITVKPGQALSLQYHHQRAEHWVVVQGVARILVGDREMDAGPGQYCFIPVKVQHRLSNPGHQDVVLIEVQCGDYLGEDDIVRLADIYGRA